ncbi:MAG: membrane protein [Candidatus Sumerlaea sp.]|jgi:drug/metabolite transporter (DMT)-like permease|nr:MAG: membrane protein [Candidatus Sumerlaea sp.]
MRVGYLFIVIASFFWGISGIFAKHLFQGGSATPLLVSHTRVIVGWLSFLVYLSVCCPGKLRVSLTDLWRFALLGVIGVAGANFGLYFAISHMDAAVADVIQFTAPVMVAVWMVVRGFERMDLRRAFALLLSVIGVMCATGVLDRNPKVTWLGFASAAGSAFAYAFLMIWGKHLSARYSQATMLHWAFFVTALFWCAWNSPAQLVSAVGNWPVAWQLAVLGLTSVTVPYACFFAGLRRIPASTAAIISTLEPVFMALLGWLILGERLALFQLLGIAFVVGAVILVEKVESATTGRAPAESPEQCS